MNTVQLSCFLAVAETLNFARAAEQLHVTQPAVTQQIHTLERELGVQLFHRTTRTVRITEEGLAFLPDARQMVGLANRAVKRFASPDRQAVRTLSLGCHGYTQLFLLAPVLKELAAQYPDLHPRLQVVPFQHLYRMLEDGDVDAVVAFRQPESRRGLSAVYRELRRVPIACLCARENPLAQRGSVALGDLAGEKLVLLDPAKARLEAVEVQAALLEGRPPSELYFCDSAEAATVLVQAGFGVSLLPDLFIPPDAPVARLPVRDVPPVSFGVYYKTLQGNPPLKTLVGLLRRHAGAKPE